MSKVIVAVMCLAAFFGGAAFGISTTSSSLTEYLAEGTLKGLNACLETTSSPALTGEEVRNVCAAKHAQNLNQNANVEGVGAPVQIEPGRFSFNGNMTNGARGYLITFVEVNLSVFTDNGNETEHRASGNIWATPFQDVEVSLPFTRQLSDEILDLEWCEHETPDDERLSCKSWHIVTIAGVPIS